MRVLIGSALYPTPLAPRTLGGAEIFARDLAERLAAAGTAVAALRTGGAGIPAEETAGGVAVRAIPARNLHPPFEARRDPVRRLLWHALDDWAGDAGRLGHAIASFRPDVVHTNTLSGLTTALWRAARAAGVPVVHTLHDYYLTCPRCSRFSGGARCAGTCGGCRLLTRRRRRATALVDAVVGVSRRILDIHLAEGLFAGAATRTVVRNACSVADLVPGPRYAGGPVTVGFIGRATPEKGLDRLAAAMAGLPPDRVRLVVAGRVSPPEQARLRALAPGADLAFLGFVPPAAFYGRVDLVALPSLWEEPAALVVVEALAAGRPVLGSPYGGTPELVRDGENGWIVTPETGALRAALAGIADRPEALSAMQDAALRAGRAYGFDDVVRAYRDLYGRVSATAVPAGAVAATPAQRPAA
ncbi:glycosyltransferase family 4 protein [Methylobacterium sp. NEAU 140]|uniref:glycosyltransferase family 4 protein n=1 Tax=Methylobacterium sp. NEAU 140 TaxID=3064945 RepID=UPI0027343C99|nr:glycosyltransferase family 4 protein [Methylobacterium sp. NEAU 140]MDP4021785.1 glycosyltransferase family 4 protein [Methylobacterium sp. NEAU 140]